MIGFVFDYNLNSNGRKKRRKKMSISFEKVEKYAPKTFAYI